MNVKIYRTAEVAAAVGVHPNTVRLYEKLGLIPKPERQANGYRVFTALHIQQLALARTAFQIEVLRGGLRRKIVAVVRLSAAGDFDAALALAQEYLDGLRAERRRAEEAIGIVQGILAGKTAAQGLRLKRREAADALGVSADTLRNWEMNGLLTVRRRENGYRVYTDEDIRWLKIIRTLRCAGYSLEAILRMLRQLSEDPSADIRAALNTPAPSEDVVSVCDRLILSLTEAERNAQRILAMLRRMKKGDSR